MTSPPTLEDSGLHARAALEFDAAVDAITAAVAPLASERVRETLDEFKRATHQLLRAQRHQVIDDCQAVISRLEARVRNLEHLMREGDPDDPTGYDSGRR